MKESNKPKSKFSAIWNFISTLIVAIIAIIAIAFLVIKATGLQVFTIESGSMYPDYPINSLVLVKETDPSEIEVGDVITYVFNDDGVYVTHRVVEIDADSQNFITKGDANTQNDSSPVYWGNVVGKVVFDVPMIGYPVKVLTDRDNLSWIITVIAIIGVICVTLDIFEKRRLKKEKDADSLNGDEIQQKK
ncbi:MAG: signal peptidase I [Clostridiales bacterium]|nr:signal peptidase I [Clostridiales bacterium]